MNTQDIRLAADNLDTMRKRLAALKDERATLNCKGHQHEISVTVGTVRRVMVASASYETGYTTRMIRGREMIALGVIKAFDGWIDEAEREVAKATAKLSSLLSTDTKEGRSNG